MYLTLFSLRKHAPVLAATVATVFILPFAVRAGEPDWSLGVYAGQYYDSEPAGVIQGRANFNDQYLLALTGSKTVWRSATLPLSLEVDAMLGQQAGVASLTEVALAPALRWDIGRLGNAVQTALRLAPLGVSYTSVVSPLERGPQGEGDRLLNYLFIEAAFSRPAVPANEFFVRLHHRCTVYDLINNYGANGEDFLALGYRYRF
jgi:hypothetical protein